MTPTLKQAVPFRIFAPFWRLNVGLPSLSFKEHEGEDANTKT